MKKNQKKRRRKKKRKFFSQSKCSKIEKGKEKMKLKESSTLIRNSV